MNKKEYTTPAFKVIAVETSAILADSNMKVPLNGEKVQGMRGSNFDDTEEVEEDRWGAQW